MALCDREIREELKLGNIIYHPLIESNIQVNSIDVTLGENYYREITPATSPAIYNIWDRDDVKDVWKLYEAINSGNDKVIWIKPGERILAHTVEFIGGKNGLTTMMKARSSMNRAFISVCMCAGLGDSYYTNRWTLEITNHSRYYTIPLIVGRRVAQIIFFRTGKTETEYNGKYQGTTDMNKLISEWSPESMLPKLYLDKELE
jgi:dCTP deaminase